MIFVTTGTQEPFDRLIKAIDELAPLLDNVEIVAQVSHSSYIPRHIKTLDFLSPKEFSKLFNRASLIVGHSGMGTIISALQNGKTLIVMPRLAKFQEHRNDHQLATAKKFKEYNFVHVAFNEEELKEKILLFFQGKIKPLHTLGNSASESLIFSLKEFINNQL